MPLKGFKCFNSCVYPLSFLYQFNEFGNDCGWFGVPYLMGSKWHRKRHEQILILWSIFWSLSGRSWEVSSTNSARARLRERPGRPVQRAGPWQSQVDDAPVTWLSSVSAIYKCLVGQARGRRIQTTRCARRPPSPNVSWDDLWRRTSCRRCRVAFADSRGRYRYSCPNAVLAGKSDPNPSGRAIWKRSGRPGRLKPRPRPRSALPKFIYRHISSH